jgi:hypothetical protein
VHRPRSSSVFAAATPDRSVPRRKRQASLARRSAPRCWGEGRLASFASGVRSAPPLAGMRCGFSPDLADQRLIMPQPAP